MKLSRRKFLIAIITFTWKSFPNPLRILSTVILTRKQGEKRNLNKREKRSIVILTKRLISAQYLENSSESKDIHRFFGSFNHCLIVWLLKLPLNFLSYSFSNRHSRIITTVRHQQVTWRNFNQWGSCSVEVHQLTLVIAGRSMMAIFLSVEQLVYFSQWIQTNRQFRFNVVISYSHEISFQLPLEGLSSGFSR